MCRVSSLLFTVLFFVKVVDISNVIKTSYKLSDTILKLKFLRIGFKTTNQQNRKINNYISNHIFNKRLIYNV